MTGHFKVVKDPEKIKIGLEKTRSNILKILKEDDHTIKEIAERLDKDRSTIYRHVKKLEQADYLKCKNTDDGKNKYSRVAHTIFLDLEYMDYYDKRDIILDWDLDFKRQDLVRMDKLGYSNDKSERFVKEIRSFFSELDNILKDRSEDVEEKNMMVLMRAKLLGYMILCYKKDECRKKFDKIFSKFKKNINLNLNEGDPDQR